MSKVKEHYAKMHTFNSFFFPSSEIIYDPIPKCGNSSVLASLLINEGMMNSQTLAEIEKKPNALKLGFIQDLSSRFRIRSNKNFFSLLEKNKRICFIRNPIDRLTSAINDKLFSNKYLFNNEDAFDYIYWNIANSIFDAKYWRGEELSPSNLIKLKQGFTLDDFFSRYLFNVETSFLDWHFIPYSMLVNNKSSCTFLPINMITDYLENELMIKSYKINENNAEAINSTHDLSTNTAQFDKKTIANLKEILQNSPLYTNILDLYADDYELFNNLKSINN